MKGDLLRFEQIKLVLLPEQGAPVELRLAQIEDRIIALLLQFGRVEVGVMVEVDLLQACVSKRVRRLVDCCSSLNSRILED